MQLWIGLGNPGSQYAGNRHNAGFMLLDALAESYRAPSWSKKFNALATEIELFVEGGTSPPSPLGSRRRPLGGSSSQKIILLKPQQFMNRSGQAVGEAMRFYKLTPADITVFHDELDISFATLRVKTGGGHGGHNGLRDIDAHIGKDYRRVRLGIGHPGDKNLVTPYVLGDFSGSERAVWNRWLEAIVAGAPLLATNQQADFMKMAKAASV